MIAKYLLHLTPHLLTLIKTLRLKNYSQLLVWDETRSFLFGLYEDDTAGKDTDMQQLTSKIQAMGYSVDVGVYYLSEENYEVVNEDDYLNYNIGVHQDFYEYFENVYIYPDSFELILSDWKEESSK